jgi:hypothetical protein
VTHFVVTCAKCGKEGDLCPRREAGLDVWERAALAFTRAGWYQPPTTTKERTRNAERDVGGGTWYCPTCAKFEPWRSSRPR